MKIAFTLLFFSCFWATSAALWAQKGQVIIFLSEDCPVSLSQSVEIRTLEGQFGEDYDFTYAFPISKRQSEVEEFLQKAQLSGDVVLEGALERAHELQATTLPEAFVFNTQDELVYRGRIDNSFARIGKRNRGDRIRDLFHALYDNLRYPHMSLRVTEPVGCLIPQTNAP